jgi:hypothetical protein
MKPFPFNYLYIIPGRTSIFTTGNGKFYNLGKFLRVDKNINPDSGSESVQSGIIFEKTVEDTLFEGYSAQNELTDAILGIDQIIVNGDFTKVIFKDGTSSSVRRKHADPNKPGDTEDKDDREVAVLYCLMEHAIPGFKTSIRKKIALAEEKKCISDKNRLDRSARKAAKKDVSKKSKKNYTKTKNVHR